MKLRYYMRGLGIGVIVAAVLMGIALGGDKEKLSDAEIMARAKELGMVESSVLADLGKEKEPQLPQQSQEMEENTDQSEQSKEDQEGSTSQPEQSKEDQEESTSQPEQSKEDQEGSTSQPEQSKEDQNENTNVPGQNDSEQNQNPSSEQDTEDEYVTLVIERGESSVSVSRSLAQLGLVESAKAYDRYLCENGYDKLIRVGTHKIKVGSTEEEIAEIISRKKN